MKTELSLDEIEEIKNNDWLYYQQVTIIYPVQ